MINRKAFFQHCHFIWALFIVVNSTVLAQTKDATKYKFYNGLFCGLGRSNMGIALAGGYFIQDRYNLYLARVLCSSELNLFEDSPDEGILDVGFLYGRCYRKRFANVSASAGIAAIWGTRRGAFIGPGGLLSGDRYEEDHFFTVGIPIQIQFFFTPLPVVDIGIVGYGNANPEMYVYGVLLCLQIVIVHHSF